MYNLEYLNIILFVTPQPVKLSVQLAINISEYCFFLFRKYRNNDNNNNELYRV